MIRAFLFAALAASLSACEARYAPPPPEPEPGVLVRTCVNGMSVWQDRAGSLAVYNYAVYGQPKKLVGVLPAGSDPKTACE